MREVTTARLKSGPRCGQCRRSDRFETTDILLALTWSKFSKGLTKIGGAILAPSFYDLAVYMKPGDRGRVESTAPPYIVPYWQSEGTKFRSKNGKVPLRLEGADWRKGGGPPQL
jgi:hypothetical protein